MKNLAIIGASYLQLPLIQKAKELGYTTHVFAWAANDVGEDAADFFFLNIGGRFGDLCLTTTPVQSF